MIIFIFQICLESDRSRLIQTLLHDLLQIRKCAAADKQNISGIYCGQGNHGILTVRPHRDLDLAAFQKLQHPLLDRFPADISLIGIFLFGDLINFIDKNNPVFRLLHVIVRGSQKLADYAFNVVSDISCFCK